MLTRNFQQLQHEVAYHVEADRVAQGSYSTCFIGCLAHGEDNPDYIEAQYGIPLVVTRIAESIFEGLPEDEAIGFFAALPSAVGFDGKDLSRVGWQFLASELRSLPPVLSEIQAVIDPVIAGMDLLAAGKEWSKKEAAHAACEDAWAACDNACDDACDDAWAARAAREAARAACENACEDARAARHPALAAWAVRVACEDDSARRRQRDLLLKLIKEAPKQN